MVMLNLTREEVELLFDLLPTDPDLDSGGGDSQTYEKLYDKVADARFRKKKGTNDESNK